jgi:hypothetical protein
MDSCFVTITAMLVFLTPLAWLAVAVGEAFDARQLSYHWLTLIPLAVVAVIWLIVLSENEN